ncbi:hypothetical protein ACT16_06500 [Mycobacterium heckeshornense]|nr:hypothetical protein ACT16_06500 [Mycobacterium heckeshornense]
MTAPLTQSVHALQDQPPLVHLVIMHRHEDGAWRDWDTADYEFGPLTLHRLPDSDDLDWMLREYIDEVYEPGEWVLEARDPDTGVVLAESEVAETTGVVE